VIFVDRCVGMLLALERQVRESSSLDPRQSAEAVSAAPSSTTLYVLSMFGPTVVSSSMITGCRSIDVKRTASWPARHSAVWPLVGSVFGEQRRCDARCGRGRPSNRSTSWSCSSEPGATARPGLSARAGDRAS